MEDRGLVAGGSAATNELRRLVASHLMDRRDWIAAHAVAAFPLPTHSHRLDRDSCVQLGTLIMKLLSEAILDGHSDSRAAGISDLTAFLAGRDMSPDQFFSFVHIAMNTAIDDLSQHERVGMRRQPWPQAAQTVRRAAFDLLGAWAMRMTVASAPRSIEDPLTTLLIRPVIDAALPKECCRAERFEHWLSMVLLDIDNLSAINQTHGYGVGDRILERMGILMRSYFREHDWVSRYAEDTIAVLLPETNPDDAMTLADRTRSMIEERLTFRDYRTEQRIVVTVSVAVTSARALEGEPIDHVKFRAAAEAALERAKTGGRNRVEHVQLLPRLISIEEATRLLQTTVAGIEKLVADGTLDPVNTGRHVRLQRDAVEALVRRGL